MDSRGLSYHVKEQLNNNIHRQRRLKKKPQTPEDLFLTYNKKDCRGTWRLLNITLLLSQVKAAHLKSKSIEEIQKRQGWCFRIYIKEILSDPEKFVGMDSIRAFIDVFTSSLHLTIISLGHKHTSFDSNMRLLFITNRGPEGLTRPLTFTALVFKLDLKTDRHLMAMILLGKIYLHWWCLQSRERSVHFVHNFFFFFYLQDFK